MRRLASLVLAATLAALPVSAQEDGEDGRGFLTGLIEDNLSGAGREVRIAGFEGALSSRATLDELTIADDEGVWLTLRDAVLDWNRGALLRGRLEVNALTAAELILPRLPEAGETTEVPSPSAGGFTLPELQVAVNIGELSIGRAALGEALFGTAAEVSLDGSVSLAGGNGDFELAVERVDGQEGRLILDAAFENATRELSLSLDLTEAPDGIAANLLGLPDRPSVALSVRGDGPLSDFTADVRLATAGTERLTGQVQLREPGDAAGERRFAADLSGDLAPVFAPDVRPFFGDDIALVVAGRQPAGGGTVLERLDLTTRHLRLEGSAEIAADGLPERFALAGEIADETGAPVRLPLPGVPTRIDRADLDIGFDAAEGERWTADIVAEGLDRPDIATDRLALTGGGRIARTGTGQSVTADLAFAARGLALAEPAVTEAIGTAVDGRAVVAWQQGQPVAIETLTVSAEGLALNGSGTLDGLDSAVTVRGEADATVADLAAFSTLAGRDLGGRAEARIAGSGAVLGGNFDVTLTADGRDLAFGVAQVDPLLRGESRLALEAARDRAGTRIDRFEIAADRADISLSGTLRETESWLALEAELADLADMVPGASGRATLSATGEQNGSAWQIGAEATAPGQSRLRLDASVDAPTGRGAVEGTLRVSSGDISAYSALAGQPLAGALELEAEGRGEIAARRFDVTVDATGRGLRLSMPQADPLIGRTVRVNLSAAGTPADVTLRQLDIDTGPLTASVSGDVAQADSDLSFRARLSDIGLLASGISGPLTAEGSAGHAGGDWRVAVQATGPGGTTARVNGTLADDFDRADLSLSGQAPAEIANSFIAPNSVRGTVSYDLRLAGPLQLASLSGRVSAGNARLVIPEPAPGFVLNDVAARMTLSDGQARVSASAVVEGGGRVTVEGPVALSPPFGAGLSATLSNVVITDPRLYETLVNARLAVEGPLAGGAAVTGTVTLGESELQIPSTGMGAAGEIPEIRHLNEPADVRRTRARAGLIGEDGDGGGAGAAYPLDILVRAPGRVFIRGRGLDAELGGQLRVSGTTANVIPSGQFELIRGRLDILGQRLNLTEGSATLQGAFIPTLRLIARTEADDVVIFIEVRGRADDPEIVFRSEPELPEDEVLARLIFGRSVSRLSPLQAARLASAVATLAGRGGAGIIGNLRQSIGLADLDVRTTEEGGTAVTAGTYITDNLYTDIELSDGQTEIQLNLDVTSSVTARGKLGTDGETSLGIFFERDY